MAERRMFAKSVVQSDLFLDMPATAQLLFFHLGMEADDDGFLANAKRVMRSIGAATDDMRMLILKGFVIDMGDGVVVLTHWRACNYIPKDRYKPTLHTEKSGLLKCDKSGQYKLIAAPYTDSDTFCIQNVSSLDTQLGKLGELGECISSNQLDESDSFEAPKQPKRSKKPIEEPTVFTRFYTEYPKHEGRKPALMAWLKLNPSAELAETIIAHVKRRKETVWRGKDKQFILLPATFLNEKRWEDELMPTTRRMEAADRELN